MFKQEHVNVTDLLPVKMYLNEHLSPKSVANVFASQGIPMDLLGQEDTYLPAKRICGLYEQAARLMGDPNFGVSCGASWGHELLGTLGEYATAAPNLRLCLLRLISAIHMYEGGTSGSLTQRGDLAKFSYFINWGHSLGRHHVSASNLGLMLSVVRYYMGKDWLPVRIETDTLKNQSSTFIEDYYEVPVKYEQNGISLVFPIEDLETPNPNRGLIFSDYTLRDLGTLLANKPPSTTTDAVVQVIRLRLLGGLVDLDGAARQLDLSPRVLQRRLAVEGETYRNLLIRERHTRAIEFLTANNHTISEISKKLGYEYESDFSRAFAKVEGIAPRVIRQSRQ